MCFVAHGRAQDGALGGLRSELGSSLNTALVVVH